MSLRTDLLSSRGAWRPRDGASVLEVACPVARQRLGKMRRSPMAQARARIEPGASLTQGAHPRGAHSRPIHRPGEVVFGDQSIELGLVPSSRPLSPWVAPCAGALEVGGPRLGDVRRALKSPRNGSGQRLRDRSSRFVLRNRAVPRGEQSVRYRADRFGPVCQSVASHGARRPSPHAVRRARGGSSLHTRPFTAGSSGLSSVPAVRLRLSDKEQAHRVRLLT